MKDLIDVVNVAHQVKKLLKLYSLRKYSILLKLRLKLQIWNVSPVRDIVFLKKKTTRKKFSPYATEPTALPIFRNDSDAEVRTKDRIAIRNRGKGMERYGGDLTWHCLEKVTFKKFAHWQILLPILEFVFSFHCFH